MSLHIPAKSPRRAFPTARWLNLLLGAWLFTSACLWSEYDGRSNSMIVGLCITAVALYAMFMPPLRWLNTALAAWLLVSTFFVFDHVTSGAVVNDAIIGLSVLVLSLVPADGSPRRASGRTHARNEHHEART